MAWAWSRIPWPEAQAPSGEIRHREMLSSFRGAVESLLGYSPDLLHGNRAVTGRHPALPAVLRSLEAILADGLVEGSAYWDFVVHLALMCEKEAPGPHQRAVALSPLNAQMFEVGEDRARKDVDAIFSHRWNHALVVEHPAGAAGSAMVFNRGVDQSVRDMSSRRFEETVEELSRELSKAREEVVFWRTRAEEMQIRLQRLEGTDDKGSCDGVTNRPPEPPQSCDNIEPTRGSESDAIPVANVGRGSELVEASAEPASGQLSAEAPAPVCPPASPEE